MEPSSPPLLPRRRTLPCVLAALGPVFAMLFSGSCRAPGREHLLVSRPLAASAPSDSVPRTAAEEMPIVTDRPGLLFAPTLVPPRRLQVEAGLPSVMLVRGPGEARTWTLPVALRYGLSERVELRSSLPTWTDVRDETGGSGTEDAGFGDAELGAKLGLTPLAGGPLALLGSVRLPTGEEGFTNHELGASAFVLHGRDLGRESWFQALLGISYVPIDGADDQTSGALGALVSHPLAERWSGFLEVATLPGLRHVAGQSYAGAGLVWAPLERLQLDLSADFGLDDDSADLIASFGLSFF